uniref:Titin n=1 Tax=Triatoma infestans TaxID=30076 RepID=A0A170USD4_TRIIF
MKKLLESDKKEKKKKKKKIKHVTVEEDKERDSVDIEEVVPLETATTFTETTESATAKRTFDIQESVSVSAVASCKKVNDGQAFPTDEPQVAGVVAPIHKPVTVVETIAEDSISEIKLGKKKDI